MKNLTLALFLALFVPGAVMASGSHSHDEDGGHSLSQTPVSSAEVIKRASTNVNRLAKTGIIDASWSGIQADGAEQKTYAKNTEWVVTFKNPNLKDSAKQSLYLFFSLDGHYIAANYTGK